ncbi:MAG: hypothetical protein LBE81_05060 [Azonexus sp.]|jgi:hypothetical protein|uniref:hypothetical protein n=1 Tax=Azonexus sp. TaxID=1872668 RepID=UPI0028353592|nr:hypothetical protein [Azonexus sp.]MDR0775989.1 hypothetical protein [Azonexus sp.]
MNPFFRQLNKLAPGEGYWAGMFFVFFITFLLPFGNGPIRISLYLGILLPALLFSTWQEVRRLAGSHHFIVVVILCAYALVRSGDLDTAQDILKPFVFFLLLVLGAMKLPTTQPASVKRAALFFIVALLVYLLANAVYQGMTQDWRPGMRLDPLFGRLYNVIYCSAVMVSALVVYSWACLKTRDYRSLIMANAVVIISAFWLLQSRTALPAWAGSMAILLISTIPSTERRRVLPWLLLSMLAIASLAFPALFERGNSYRLEIWADYLTSMRECGTFFGCGWGVTHPSFTTKEGFDITHPHSIYVQHLFWGGITGLALLLLTLLLPLIAGIRRGHFAAWALLPGCVALAFDGKGFLMTSLPAQQWLLVIVPLALLIAGLAGKTMASTTFGEDG